MESGGAIRAPAGELRVESFIVGAHSRQFAPAFGEPRDLVAQAEQFGRRDQRRLRDHWRGACGFSRPRRGRAVGGRCQLSQQLLLLGAQAGDLASLSPNAPERCQAHDDQEPAE